MYELSHIFTKNVQYTDFALEHTPHATDLGHSLYDMGLVSYGIRVLKIKDIRQASGL